MLIELRFVPNEPGQVMEVQDGLPAVYTQELVPYVPDFSGNAEGPPAEMATIRTRHVPWRRRPDGMMIFLPEYLLDLDRP